MKNNQLPLLSKKEYSDLHDALHYMKMHGLKKACQLLSLPNTAKKAELIKQIIHFIKTAKILTVPKIPLRSQAKNYPMQPLEPSSLMLYGSYKNDAKTRSFFKKLIGPYFHFTAFGIDWLNNRWLKGQPPTYQEFVNFWVKEKTRRKNIKVKPKDEWMFIRFMQQTKKSESYASKEDLMKKWKKLQAKKSEKAFQLLKKAKLKLEKL